MPADLSQVKDAVAIVVAAGIGKRMLTDKPKQYLPLGGQTVLDVTLSKWLALETIERVVLVISPQDNYYQDLVAIDDPRLIIIDGGVERVDSVNNALRFLLDTGLDEKIPVFVHDGARPCILAEDIQNLLKHYRQSKQACFLATPVVDSLHKIDSKNQRLESVDRSQLVKALTPQLASFIDLKQALAKALESKALVTDEVSALALIGKPAVAVVGDANNIKITQPQDLPMAEFILAQQT